MQPSSAAPARRRLLHSRSASSPLSGDRFAGLAMGSAPVHRRLDPSRMSPCGEPGRWSAKRGPGRRQTAVTASLSNSWPSRGRECRGRSTAVRWSATKTAGSQNSGSQLEVQPHFRSRPSRCLLPAAHPRPSKRSSHPSGPKIAPYPARRARRLATAQMRARPLSSGSDFDVSRRCWFIARAPALGGCHDAPTSVGGDPLAATRERALDQTS